MKKKETQFEKELRKILTEGRKTTYQRVVKSAKEYNRNIKHKKSINYE